MQVQFGNLPASGVVVQSERGNARTPAPAEYFLIKEDGNGVKYGTPVIPFTQTADGGYTGNTTGRLGGSQKFNVMG